MNIVLRSLCTALAVTAMLTSFGAAAAAPSAALDKDVMAALQSLYAQTPAARALGDKAKGILVFPRVTKAGLMVGAQSGDGALVQKGKIVGYYNTSAVSMGLQAGVQQYGYALFFMSDSAFQHLRNTSGWELGVGPSIVVVDSGVAKTMTTATSQADIYAFIFDQKGLMGGMGVTGSKITAIDR
jgi:lipid-binding SYLF domain-containing protein